jgi:hypothetical protein
VAWSSCAATPTIYRGLDHIGTDGRARPAGEWRPAKTLEDAVANPVDGQRLPPRPGVR